MTFIVIRNFQKFQHYTDRKPPWIKLYRDLLDDERFFDLSDSERYYLIGLFILASQHENKIPNKPEWLRHQLRAQKAIPLQKLIDTNWLDVLEQDASGVLAPSMLATCKQDAIVETETETEKRHITQADSALPLGQFANVFLTTHQHKKLFQRFGYSGTAERIESLSEYMASKGVKYKSHYATILTWERKNITGVKHNGNMDKGERNAETARRLLSRLHSQDSGSVPRDTARSNAGSLSRASAEALFSADPDGHQPHD